MNKLKNIFFILIMVIALEFFLLWQKNPKVDQRVFSAVMPTLTVAIPTYPPQITTMDSPDGTKTLTMKKQQTNGLIKFSFYISAPDIVEKVILSKELGDAQYLSIPYNTWSPDNKYVFLKESTPILNNYYVFSASGNSISNSVQYVNIQELFSQKLPDYRIMDVTGWADPTLIIVNATSNKDGKNISFWFDVTDQSFTQLDTYFN